MKKILSLFDGISGGQIAINNLGLKNYTYYASEINKDSIAITQKNFPDTIQLGDVIKLTKEQLNDIGQPDLLIFGSPCFEKGTLILTNEGYKEIENIQAGDMVLTHTNTYRKVVKPMSRECNEIYKINTMCSEELSTTAEHPFYVRERYRIHPRINGKQVNIRKFKKPEWIKAKNLNENYYVGVAINQESILPNVESEKIKSLINNNNFWWIVGRYIGDGWTNYYKRKDRPNSYIHRVLICCDKNKKKNEINDIKEKLNGLFHYTIVEERTTYKFHINNKDFYDFLQRFGRYAYGKYLNGDIINLPKELLKSFLEGYMSADGCFTQNKNKASTVSRKLIYGLGQCVAKVYNKPFSIYKNKRRKQSIIEGRLINQRDAYEITWKNEKRKQDHAFYEDGYIWCPINNIKKEQYNTIVYNMEVEEDNSYTVNNIIVHNCVDLTIIKSKTRESLKGNQSGLFWNALKTKNYLKPKYFLMENVASMNKESKYIISKELNMQPIMINSNIFSAQERERLYWTNIPIDSLPESKGLVLKDIMETNVAEKYYYKKDFTFNGWDKRVIATLHINCHDMGKRVYNPNMTCATLTAIRGGYQEKKVYDDDRCRKLTPLEYERLQTVPDNYTYIKGLSDNKRRSMLGDGFTIKVIEYILKNLFKK